MFAELYEAVGTATSGWRNFHRLTDLIGGPVFTGPGGGHRDADQCLRDPSTKWYVPRDPPPPVLGHSGYMADESMDSYVEGLAARLLVELGTEDPRRCWRDPGNRYDPVPGAGRSRDGRSLGWAITNGSTARSPPTTPRCRSSSGSGH